MAASGGNEAAVRDGFIQAGGAVLLRRLSAGQLQATLFTCDGRADAGLLWVYEAEALPPAEWAARLRDGKATRRALAYDARVPAAPQAAAAIGCGCSASRAR